MVKSLALAILAVLAPLKEPANLEKVQPAIPGRTIVLSVDGDYRVEGETSKKSSYESLKAALDERFSAMFALQARINELHGETSKLQEEYYALNRAYNHELKKIIAAYVTESDYGANSDETENEPTPLPMPLPMPRIKTVQ